jgi:subtilisin family serine protease
VTSFTPRFVGVVRLDCSTRIATAFPDFQARGNHALNRQVTMPLPVANHRPVAEESRMKLSRISLTVSAVVALGAAATPVLADALFAQGQILVKPAAGLASEKLDKILEESGGKARRRLKGLETRVVEVPVGRELEFANRLSKRKDIAYAEPNLRFKPEAVVNDPSYGSQWHLPLMGVPTAWANGSGKGVTVAICDTGVNAAHPDLAGQVVNGWNTSANNADTSDIYGHGTKVAGVVAATANNLVGGASVAPAAKILAMRITDSSDGSAYISDMAECVTWAADNGARVANISYSGAAGSATVWNAGSYMMSKGGLVVVAAANAATDPGYDNSPYVFTAAATDSGDNRASYSNYGKFVDIAAPGSSIFTTERGGGYATVSGTSFASPNAAAVAALVLSTNPALQPTDVTAIITSSAKDLGTVGWDAYFGFGRVDAGAAVTMAANVATSDRTAPTVAVQTPGTGTTVKDLVTVDVKATDDFGVMSVDLYADGVLVGTDTQEDPAVPYVYRFAWDSTKVSDGTHKLTAKAKDAAGNLGSAQEVSVTVKNTVDTTPPSFTSTAPASGSTVSGVVTMSATASDNVGMAKVTVSGGGKSCTGTSSAACTLDVSGIAGGTTLVVSFSATDTAGNTSSEQASVVVTTTTTTTTVKVRNPRAAKK